MYIIYYPFSIRNIATQRYFLRIPRGDVNKQSGRYGVRSCEYTHLE